MVVGVVTSLWALEKHKTAGSRPTAGQETTGQGATVAYKGEDGKSALRLLNQHAAAAIALNGGDSRVESINGVKNASGKAWHLYVNGQRASSDPNRVITHNGDYIIWKFE